MSRHTAKMRCSISNCPSVYLKKNQGISFHGFPNNPNVLTAWVAATGTPDFIPTHNSKICSAHFEASDYINRKLKPDAIPIKLLTEDARIRVSEFLRKQQEQKLPESNPMICILDTNTSIKEVALVRDNIPPHHESTVVSVPTSSQPSPSSTIKVVDMEKLLQPKANLSDSSFLNSLLNQYTLNKSSPTEICVNPTGITASQILTCLRVILPGKFDLSRMIPNEKVSSLVIRYLKLDEKNEVIQNIVKDYLKIIIEAAKIKDKKSVDYTNHPYTKINDIDLRHALAFILPKYFSMIDISDELLALVCITLNLDVHSDAYYILIKKIRKFTSEGQKFIEILNHDDKVYDAPVDLEKHADMSGTQSNDNEEFIKSETAIFKNDNSGDSSVVCFGEQRRELVFVDVNNPAENSHESVDVKHSIETSITQSAQSDFSHPVEICLDDSAKPDVDVKVVSLSDDEEEEVVLKGPKRKKKNDDDSDWDPESEMPTKKVDLKSEPPVERLEAVVTYLGEKKCSAENVISDFRLMFYLCRFLNIRTRRVNIKKMTCTLQYIIDNKIDVKNVKDHLRQLGTKRNSLRFKHTTNIKCPNIIHQENEDKLKMTPVVVLQDLVDYRPEQLVFMRRKRLTSNGFYNQIPFSLKQDSSHKMYSPEQVRKLTDGSYKQFRKIIMKRDGTKAVFRVKYAKLSPGTVVYAKDFRHPTFGWVRGVITKSEGPLKYEVQLDNGSIWCCFVDQLRPLLKLVGSIRRQPVQRSHRPIKPKQLFDL